MVNTTPLFRTTLLLITLALFSGCIGTRPPVVIDRDEAGSTGSAETSLYPDDPVDTTEIQSEEKLAEPSLPSIFEREHDTLSIWKVPEWDPTTTETEDIVLDSAATSAQLTQLINGFRRGAHGGELLPQLRLLEKSLTNDSLRTRAVWLIDRIIDRDSTWMIGQLAQLDRALSEGRLDAARKFNRQMEQNIPQLMDDSRWAQRRASIEKMESANQQICSPEECDALRLESERLFSRKKFEDSLQKARLASAAPDDLRREKGWQLLHSSGEAFCDAQRSLAVESIRKHQKSKEKSFLNDAKNLLEKCLSNYPEYPQRAKIERDLQTIQQMTK